MERVRILQKLPTRGLPKPFFLQSHHTAHWLCSLLTSRFRDIVIFSPQTAYQCRPELLALAPHTEKNRKSKTNPHTAQLLAIRSLGTSTQVVYFVTHVVRGLKKQISRKSTRGSRLPEIQSEKLFLSENRCRVCVDSRSVGVNCNRGPLGDVNHFRVAFRR